MARTNKTKLRGKRSAVDRMKQRRPSKARRKIDPISQSYGPIGRAWKAFNQKLFDGELPPCLITLQRKKRALGFFAGRRFRSADGTIITDEIALNPAHFADRGAKRVLSTLGHEMAHQWQHHYGKVSRGGYHNLQWAAKMEEIGLVPSHTGRPGGEETGQRMTHYVRAGGPFDRAADKLIAKGFALAYVERTTKAARKIALKKRQSKTRYQCAGCGQNAWAKPDAHFICGDCKLRLLP